MRIEKEGGDTFIEFDNFDEVKEVFEEAIKIVEDKDGERFLVIETKEDFEKFRKLLIEAYYELHSEENAEHNSLQNVEQSSPQRPKSSK